MRPILCVIDLSETSLQVLEVAAKMAYAYKSHLTILFPYRLINNGYKGEIAKLKTTLEQEAKEKFLALKKHVPLLDQISFEFQPEIGFPADRINSFVKRNKVDCIVISQRQANLMNEVNHLTLQSLIANSKLPFTIVPEEMDTEVLS
ncbi:MAG TPA: universal stress protein [Chryseosolibacter sp.]